MATKTFKIGLNATEKQNMAQAVYERLLNLTFPEYNSSSTYVAGKYVVYNDLLYKCTGETTGTFDDSKWVEATLNDLVNDVNAAVASVNGKANVDGNYPTMTVGLANNLVATNGLTTTNSFIMELTGGDQASAVSTGNMNLVLRGNSVVVNQLSQTVNKTEQTTNGITWKIADHVMTATGTATASIFNGWEVISLIAGHKYFINGTNTMLYMSGQNLYHDGDCGIVTCSVSGNYDYQWNIRSGEVANYKFRLLVIDLTQWFNGDIPQDILDNPSNFARYYQGDLPYDTGHIENAQSTSLISRGINQWDEEWEEGQYNTTTGEKAVNTNAMRSKNRIECSPNTTYCFTWLSGARYAEQILFYDKDGNYISGENKSFDTLPATFMPPVNARFMTFFCGNINTYNHDICINVSNPDIDGNYYKFEANETLLGNDDLRSVGSVYDSKAPNGLITRRIGSYTFTGNENWQYNSNGLRWICEIPISTTSPLALSNKLNFITNVNTSVNKSISTYESKGWYFYGSGSTNYLQYCDFTNYGSTNSPASLFTVGTKIYYELAEYTTEQGTPFSENIKVVKGGTLEFIGNGIPQGNSMFFQKNLKSFLEAFGTAINYDPSRIERLANLSFTPETADIVLNPAPANAYAKVQVMSSTFTIVVSAALTGTASGTITFQDSEVDLTNFQTQPAKAIYDMDGKKVSEAPTTTDCNIASFVGRSYNGIILWSILHSGVNKIKIHFEQAIPLDENGNGKVDCRASLIL